MVDSKKVIDDLRHRRDLIDDTIKVLTLIYGEGEGVEKQVEALSPLKPGIQKPLPAEKPRRGRPPTDEEPPEAPQYRKVYWHQGKNNGRGAWFSSFRDRGKRMKTYQRKNQHEVAAWYARERGVSINSIRIPREESDD